MQNFLQLFLSIEPFSSDISQISEQIFLLYKYFYFFEGYDIFLFICPKIIALSVKNLERTRLGGIDLRILIV